MMSFESQGGLATTVENVVDNGDILIITDEQLLRDNAHTLNPGCTIITGFSGESLDTSLYAEKGLKEIIQVRSSDILTLIPPMVNGITSGELKFFSDDLILKLAASTAREISDTYRFPGFFSEISVKIESAITRG